MNWNITNIDASDTAAEIIRATNTLDTASNDCELPTLTSIEAMLDLTMSQWALGLAEILTTGIATIISNADNQECLFLTTTPRYSSHSVQD